MKKPLIGITPSCEEKSGAVSLRSNYVDSIRRAGGLPVILPLSLTEEEAEQLADTLDGVLFTGGPDLHPFLFGEETHPACGEISALRDKMEPDFFHRMYRRRKPILGICRGVQLINVALGGNIYQDLSAQFHNAPPLAHRQPFHYTNPCHMVEVVAGTKFSQIAGAPVIEVNSMHHQAIKDTAPSLTVCGRSSDGLTEAVEMDGYPYLLGVQWHPEYLYEQCDHAKRLFESFTAACRACS